MDGSSAAIEVLIQNLIDVFKQEYFLIRDVDEHAKQLQKTLGMIQAYLNDAEKKSITQDTVKFWLRELEDLAFDADNALDELSYHVLRKKIKNTKKPKQKVKLSFLSSFNHIAHRRNISHTIKQINKDFESMNKRAAELGIQTIVVSAPAVALAPHASYESDSLILDPIFIGRDDLVSDIVEKVTESPEDRKFSILAICGMGGIGKTTLTRKVFHHEMMKTRFGSHIWVHVSQTFDPITLFKKILRELGQSYQVESRQDVMKKLQEALKDRTYLFVLDDFWNEDVPKWEDFMNSISGVTSTKGNAIIITTRSTQVSSIMNPLHIHILKGLSDEDCWSIIKAKAFEDGEVPPGFETIGERIVKRCKGLPLVANVVGGVLRHKCKEEWISVEEKWLTDVEGDHISRILRLSYDNLISPSLKKCFAYCSFLPKGRLIVKEELIEMWMAEGFLQSDGRNDMESVGDMYFEVLVHSSLLQVAEGGNYAHVMHDLVHDLGRGVLGCWNNADGISLVRYSYREQQSPLPKQAPIYLRTLVFEGDISGTVFSDFASLHVLTLSNFGAKELPESIRKLIHLRRLNIARTSIERLPEWIGELHHLQTLRADTGYLAKLPRTFKYLINLRHLHIYSGVELPAEIGRLTCLQTLESFKVGDKEGYRIEELGSLNNLKGNLEICNLEKVHNKEEAQKANLFQKPNLIDLEFRWREDREGETNDESVLEGLQPHPNLNRLGIFGFKGKRFPSWSEKMAVGEDGPQGACLPLNKLTMMSLIGCSECENIPRWEHLPNIKYLDLERLKKVRFINSSFSKLMSLHIDELDALECLPDWLFYNNPNLSSIKISGCPKLREIPDGLQTLNYLEHLYIYNCPNLKSMGSNTNNNDLSGAWKSQGHTLSIGRCGRLMELSCEMVESWASSLETLSLDRLSSLENLPMLIACLAKSPSLRELSILGVPKFMATHSVESCWDFGSLWSLNICVSEESSSVGTKETVDGILKGCCNSLAQLKLGGTEDWECIPESIQYLNALSSLNLENFGVEELPQWFGNLSSLRWLHLSSCKKLKRLPAGDAYKGLTILHSIEIKDCPDLEVDSEWRSIPRLHINVDGHPIESR